ncbi:hypothetical protein [Austwickia sp. TVS 96-490-7B]|uniref:hypothetical protein n=1 Tax=Austwickia sp. TVS 96-490-7B TaxID=2830843 RepID=UPI001C59939A|nr:hypothetical protein [Austwickia sp. TVS 96-490-7B]
MMIEEGLTPIDEAERLRLQARVDSLRQAERRHAARHAAVAAQNQAALRAVGRFAGKKPTPV